MTLLDDFQQPDQYLARNDCPHRVECESEAWPGLGAMEDPIAHAMIGKPWRECSCDGGEWMYSPEEQGRRIAERIVKQAQYQIKGFKAELAESETQG